MPLFGRHAEPAPAPVVDEPRRSGTFFGRRRGSSPVNAHATTSHSSSTLTSTRHGHRTRSVSPRRSSGLLHRNEERSSGHGLLGHHSGDPSIRAAHDRVNTAEKAEREADKALLHARNMVREAREHVKRLEREAAEDARLAKLKQKEAASISKRAGKLGGL